MAVNLIRLHKLCEDKEALLSKLREWKLVPIEMPCKKCKQNLSLCEDLSR